MYLNVVLLDHEFEVLGVSTKEQRAVLAHGPQLRGLPESFGGRRARYRLGPDGQRGYEGRCCRAREPAGASFRPAHARDAPCNVFAGGERGEDRSASAAQTQPW